MSQENNQLIHELSITSPREHDSFDSINVPLVGANLIEASAGTGKTYSIAILALRLVLEKNIPIDKILMVTFTRDAAAEMELRVRNFIREGLQILRKFGEANPNFEGLDAQILNMLKAFPDKNEAQSRLQSALVQFDKAAIYTIHGFCSRILSEYAFESGQMFHATTIEPSDFDQFVTDAFNQAWRNQITVLDERLLNILLKNGLTRKKIYGLLKSAINGKKIYPSFLNQGESIQQCKNRITHELINQDEPAGDFEAMQQQAALIKQSIIQEVVDHREVWINKALADQKKDIREKIPGILSLTNEVELFKVIEEKSDKVFFKNFFPDDFKSKINDYEQKINEIKAAEKNNSDVLKKNDILVTQLISVFALSIYKEVDSQLKKIKEFDGKVTFDDLIESLHRIVCNEDSQNDDQSNRLVTVLQDRYSAVFIDEFQDTDQLQFDIFFKVFKNTHSKKHILFFIGDPKQSIYGFRKADLQTYFQAANLLDDVWRMNTNYRATAMYIRSMNEFFQPIPEFDVFMSNQMKYYKIEAPEKARVGHLSYNNNSLNPLRIICCGNKLDVFNKTANLVRKLLRDKSFQFTKEGIADSIKAGQIGILVRNKKEGRKIRERLSAFGISAVTISDEKIFESKEALELWYILQAVYEIKTGVIHRALLTKIAGISWNELTTLDVEKMIQQFREYQEVWNTSGVYKMLRQFISDSRIINRKLQKQVENADRLLANTFQLMEMLHEAETDNKYSPEELIFWLKKGIDGEKTSEDGYLQRIESDESAVKIVTMHSCKGLEYDIVIAPFLDMKSTDSFTSTQFRLEDGYYTAEKNLLEKELMEKARLQTAQENLRLLYVAITRARYHCYVLSENCNNSKNIPKSTSLKYLQSEIVSSCENTPSIRFLGSEDTHIDITSCNIFEMNSPEFSLGNYTVNQTQESPIDFFAKIPTIQLADRYWQKTSYTRLSPKQDYISLQLSEIGTDPYDSFIFKEMRKGALTGNLLHDLLERIDFSQPGNWEKIINSSINRYPGTGISQDHSELMQQMLQVITNTILPQSGFCLSSVQRSQRLSELEFDLPITQINWNDFPSDLEDNNIPLRINKENSLTGILNGKIDLFFEQNEQYYLLDWKSNHLGNSPEDYNGKALKNSMEEHNYFLQYYFYCLALYRYLHLRIPDFNYDKQFGGVYYLFIRGMRQGTDYGIYFHKPQLKDLLLLERVLLKNPINAQ